MQYSSEIHTKIHFRNKGVIVMCFLRACAGNVHPIRAAAGVHPTPAHRHYPSVTCLLLTYQNNTSRGFTKCLKTVVL